MNKSKMLNAIGMAFAAQKTLRGEQLMKAIIKSKVQLVILAIDMGNSQKKKFLDKCNYYQIKCYKEVLTIDEITKACGAKKIVAIGFNDNNIIKLIESSIL